MNIIIIIGCTAVGGPWPPLENVASDLSPEHPPADIYNPISLRLPITRQSILISVGHVLVDFQGFVHNNSLGNIVFIHSHNMARPPQATRFYYVKYIWRKVKSDKHAAGNLFSTVVGILLWELF
jgi:hypothetical protein